MPLTNSYNALSQNNEQPEYQVLWEPIAVNPTSVATLTFPSNNTYPASNAGYLVPGSVLQFGPTGAMSGNASGVGNSAPQGFGQTYPGGDASGAGATGNNTFPYYWTVQNVDAATASSTTQLAGVCIGFGSLGAFAIPQANTTPSSASITNAFPVQMAMVGKRGIVQVLFDGSASTTSGNTFVAASTASHVGCAKDSGGTTRTFGTTLGVILQTVTFANANQPQLIWCYLNAP